MDSISISRLEAVAPQLMIKISLMAEMLEPQGIRFRVTQGLRTWEQQDALYAQGRTTPGNIVTNCPGGCSYHNFGLAVDLVPSLGGSTYIPDWNPNHPTWKRMEEVGKSLALGVGVEWRSFPDAPHFELVGRFPAGAPDDEVRQLFKDGGLQKVWDASGI